jgi:hypothetical protein
MLFTTTYDVLLYLSTTLTPACVSDVGCPSFGCRNVVLRGVKEHQARRLSSQDLKTLRETVEFIEREVRNGTHPVHPCTFHENAHVPVFSFFTPR